MTTQAVAPAERGARLAAPALFGAAIALALVAALSRDFRQATVNGLVDGSYIALGAIGLTFVYGILKLVNFAHGDLLTLGAYVTLTLSAGIAHLPLAVAIAGAVAAVAALSVLLEKAMWRPMRDRGAGALQLILLSIGLAFVLRNATLLVAGGDVQTLGVNVTSSVSVLGGVHIGTTQLRLAAIAYAVLLAVGLLLRRSSLGKQMRALADNLTLAATTGIDTGRVILTTWTIAGGLAALAGALYVTSAGAFDPNFGFVLLLSLFAAVILGGIGNAYGALVGGIMLGLVEAWSTLLIADRWKIAVGFAALIVALVARPQGVFGRAVTR